MNQSVRRRGRTVRLVMSVATLTVTAGALPGCAVISGSSRSSLTGKYVGPETFAQIKTGTTTEDWLIAALGQPTSKSKLDDGTSLWKWAYERNYTSRGGLLLVFSSRTCRTEEGATFVQLRDGVVAKAWRD